MQAARPGHQARPAISPQPVSFELDKGATVAIARAADQQFQVGKRVRVLRGPNGEARVQSI